MKLSPVIPLMYTDELQATIDFYVNVLGFVCGEYNEEWGWAAVHRDDCEIMFSRPNEHTLFERPKFSGSFYIRTDDVDALWLDLKDRCNLCYGLDVFEWGMKEFAIYDNNGYTIQFGQQVN